MSYILSEYAYRQLKTEEEKVAAISLCEQDREKVIDVIETIKNNLSPSTPYNKENKADILGFRDLLLETLNGKGNWIGHSLEKCLKKELVGNIHLVCLRTTESLTANHEMLIKWKSDIQKAQAYRKKREDGRKLLERLYNHEDFEDIKESYDQRQWDCLVDLIEDGTVNESNLHEYGIYFD